MLVQMVCYLYYRCAIIDAPALYTLFNFFFEMSYFLLSQDNQPTVNFYSVRRSTSAFARHLVQDMSSENLHTGLWCV